ncbi:MAG TPA: dTDP-4-dehydrorhamnose 3,5-epimerase family protein, partial [Parvularculaceae bacterium]|nr:dTDP-4-dehydrorhamnose 3,5-epimerase family protein [Parvularculaceae bacterium]
MLDIQKTDLDGVLLITPKRFEDARGFFSETFNAERFRQAGVTEIFVQDNHSFSRRAGTVRGLHYQAPPRAQAKLVRVLKGAVIDVAVDVRQGSPTYGRHARAH